MQAKTPGRILTVADVTFGYLARIEFEREAQEILKVFSRLPDHCYFLLAAARGGLTELVCDGVTGFLFVPSIAGDLESACRPALAAIPAYDGFAAAARLTSARFQSHITARAYEAFFTRILHGT